jgi:hypothetical protein
MATEILIKGIPSRILPQMQADNQREGIPPRFDRFGGVFTQPRVRKSHLLADEGSYFVANSAQTGLATSLLGTTFSQTSLSPFLVIQNTDSVGGKRIYVDYIDLVTTAAGVAAAGLTFIALAITSDSTLRYSSASTINGSSTSGALIVSPNQDISTAKSVAQIFAGPIILTAASSAARQICGQRTLRPTASATAADVIGEEKILNFGGVEGGMYATYATLTAINSSEKPLPPFIIGPQQSGILHLWSPGAALTTGISFAPEIGWWES